MHTFTKFVRLTKVDAARREVYGVVTSEAPDKDGEICDYGSTVPYYRAWSAEFAHATEGKSLGNVREMHTRSAVGKVVDLVFDDANKTIAVHARIIDGTAWAKCEEGVYTGFSHGGEYVGEPWPDGEFMRYTAKPSEISLVDNPCNPEAHFEYVKADGTVELRKFSPPPVKAAPAGESKFAGGDPTLEPPPSNPADSNNAAPPATANQPEAENAPMKKLMLDVAELANLLAQVNVIRGYLTSEAETEGDASPIPAKLKVWIEDGVLILSELVVEEGAELTANKITDPGGTCNTELHPDAAQETTPAATAAADSILEKLAATDPLAKAVLEQQQQIADLAGAVKNLTEAMRKAFAEPLPRKTAGPGVAVTKEQDSLVVNHNPEARKANDPKALLKECLSKPVLDMF